MGSRSGIEWTDASWNPVRGCTRVSEGCRNCYAETIAARFSDPGQPYHGFAQRVPGGGRWTGKVSLIPKSLYRPFEWHKPREIFVNSMSDLFHEDLPDEAIDQVFAVMALNPRHTFQILTKRAARMHTYMCERWQPAPAQTFEIAGDVVEIPAETIGAGRRNQIVSACEDIIDDRQMAETSLEELWDDGGNLRCMQWQWPLPNVHLGVSAEDQRHADERIPLLLATPAARRIVSFEPLLGLIDITQFLWGMPDGCSCEDCPEDIDCECGWNTRAENLFPSIDQAIVGGESGTHARPMDPRWVRGLRDQCVDAKVPFFFKQWGEWYVPAATVGPQYQGICTSLVRIGKRGAGATLDGREWREKPPR
jgi:protein gp37